MLYQLRARLTLKALQEFHDPILGRICGKAPFKLPSMSPVLLSSRFSWDLDASPRLRRARGVFLPSPFF
jgi:hypothetical protein